MKLDVLSDLLNVDAQAIEKYDTEQLRLVLGVARYFVRSVEREINHRESNTSGKENTFL